MALLPVAVYGLEVQAGDVMIPAVPDFPATFRITMAAIDPSAPPQVDDDVNGDVPARATLKIIRQPPGMDDDDDSEGESDEEDYLNALLGGADSEDEDDDDESSDEEEETNGGPSDPSKNKKARKNAAVEQLKQALADEDNMEVGGSNGMNGVLSKSNKGKAKATGDEEESDDEGEDLDLEEFVICTLDASKNYQQPLDLTVAEGERVYFKVSGTHNIYLTGNYVIPADEHHSHGIYDGEDEEDDYDLSPDDEEIDDDEESDELDALEDPRLIEVMSDDEAEEAPKLIKSEKKGKNKRAAANSDDEPANLDDIMAKSLKPAETTGNGDTKLSKKQLKKMKNNAGEAVATAIETAVEKPEKKEDKPAKDASTAKTDKKVQFAKKLEQGPSSTSHETKPEAKSETKKDEEQSKASLGVKMIQGVKIDDKKLGKGPVAKKGDKISMRYIGKLQDGKVFDANKKGKPFTFKLGVGEVIKGWDIGVAGMSVGGERRFVIPPSLAYGSKSTPGIPSNSTLIFEVKLLEIK
ncbi:MAG: peptidylprolyl isomerase fpr4 [Pleopsidium flavum]|nr:MAG: peptidylprolyl isomerase fpr4 [Pleopsidium flavum]